MADTDRLASGRRLEPSAPSEWVARFVLALAAELDAASTRWVILRNHQDLPDRVGHDVDIIVHPDDVAAVGTLLRALVRREGLALLRAYAGIEHETFDVAAANLHGRLLLHVDVQTAARYRGRLLVDADDLLGQRRQVGQLWVPTPAMEAYALLLHAALNKKQLKPRYARRLTELRLADPAGLERLAGARLGPDLARRLNAVRTEADLMALRGLLRRALRRRYPANPARQAWFAIRSPVRQARLRLRPRGAFVAFLGPDGSGKSTLTDLLVRRLQGHDDVLAVHRVYMGSGMPLLPTRRIMRRLHGRTGRNPKPPATLRGIAPRRLRGPLHVMADEILRYWVRVRPRLAPHGLVLVDRYAYDVLRVNNQTVQRAWFRRLAVTVIPRPHLTILLEGDPVAVAARKRELTVEETIRQQAAYRALEHLVPNFVPVDLTVRDDRAIDLVAMKVLGAYARRNRGLVPW